MITRLQIRYIPAWLSGVTEHYNADYADFEKVISKHDVKLFKLANQLVMTKLNHLGILVDYDMRDAEVEGGFSEADALFALYGNNPKGKQVSEFDLTRFKIFSDKANGILLIEDPKAEPQNLYEALLTAIAFYVGKEASYASATFTKYLASVNNH